jgi:hypothetical protein
MSGQTQQPAANTWTVSIDGYATATWSHVEAPTAWTADSLSQLIGEPCTEGPSSIVGTWEPFCSLVKP